jgi:plasmid stability protein
MHEVHPPHEAAHSWRDILIHLAIMTVGLFIALTLESMVEAAHHRHLRAEARENIRQEIEENLQQLPKNAASMQADLDRMKKNVAIIRQLRDHPHTPHDALHFQLYWSGFNDAAWRTARDTGALSYMPYHEVQDLSQLYSQQQYINSRGAALFTDQDLAPRAILAEDSVDDLRPAEIDELLRSTTALEVEIESIQELLTHFQEQYEEAEKLEK